MNSNSRIALIPAYMPGETMLDILKDLKNEGYRIITVDDGSGEEFRARFEEAAKFSTVITHTENKGKGEALKTGLKFIKENITAPYTVVTLDADGQHKISDALKVCAEAEAHPSDLVLGSRMLEKSAPIKSRIGNNITNVLYKLTTGMKLCDTQTGLRAFSNELVDKIAGAKGSRYEYEMNVLLAFARQKNIREVWIETVYIDNNSATHFKAVRDSCRIYKVFFKFAFSKKS